MLAFHDKGSADLRGRHRGYVSVSIGMEASADKPQVTEHAR